MRTRNIRRREADLHAEVYHQSKIAKLREEGEYLRRELRQRGIDPAIVLLEAQQRRFSARN
jgi:hypothetical protein